MYLGIKNIDIDDKNITVTEVKKQFSTILERKKVLDDLEQTTKKDVLLKKKECVLWVFFTIFFEKGRYIFLCVCLSVF